MKTDIAFAAIAFCACSLWAEGNVTYHLNKEANPTEDQLDAYTHIEAAMDSATYLYNKYTNLTKHIEVYYNTGVPTAEASSNGTLSFGSSRTYMVVCTAMHETAHTLGMGTTSEYQAMMVNGVFQGKKAQALLKELTGDPTAELHGDSQHFWPYGLNYASEVKSEQDLIFNAKIVDAMYQDIFKEALYFSGRVRSVGTGLCMGITESNALTLQNCADTSTFVKITAVGEPVAYRIAFGTRGLDVPNESVSAGTVLGTYTWNGGTHQKMYKENLATDTSSFYLKIVKSGLYVKASGTSLIQDSKAGEDNLYQWTLLNSSTETPQAIRLGIRAAHHASPKTRVDAKGRSISAKNTEQWRSLFSR